MENDPRNIPRTEGELNAPDDRDISIEGPLSSMPVVMEESVGVHEHNTAVRNSGSKPKLRLGKKSRIGEFLVEQSIRAIAFLSFAVIILIFVFVFREAAPMFTSSGAGHGSTTSTSVEQETYGEEPAAAPPATVEQEVYDPFADDKPATTSPSPSSGTVPQEVYDPFASDTASAAAATQDTSLVLTTAPVSTAEQEELARQVSEATSFENLLIDVWQPVSEVPKYGLIPLFIGTLKVTLIALLFAAPLAILAAMFTSTFAPRWAREIVKPGIELLAGFPSVVIGFFALIVMATIMQDLFGYQFRLNSLVGGIAMSFAVIPIIYTISEDALVSVPKSLREASDALGATKWQTASRVILPAAVPGVFAAVVLGFGRAFGETMIALMATGNAPLTSWNILEPVRTFSATIGAEMAEVVFGDQHYNVLFFIGALLFIFTFTMNALVEFWVRKRLLRRIQGK